MSSCYRRRIALLKAMKNNFMMLFSINFFVALCKEGIIVGIMKWLVVAFTFFVSSICDIYCMMSQKNFPEPTRMSIVDGEVVYYPDDE